MSGESKWQGEHARQLWNAYHDNDRSWTAACRLDAKHQLHEQAEHQIVRPEDGGVGLGARLLLIEEALRAPIERCLDTVNLKLTHKRVYSRTAFYWAAWTAARDPEMHATGDSAPPAQAVWAAVRRGFGKVTKEQWEQVQSKDMLMKTMNLGSDRSPKKRPHDTFLDGVAILVGAHRGTPVWRQSLFDEPYTGPSGIADFEKTLKAYDPMLQPLLGPREPIDRPSPRVAEAVDKLMAFVTPPPPGQIAPKRVRTPGFAEITTGDLWLLQRDIAWQFAERYGAATRTPALRESGVARSSIRPLLMIPVSSYRPRSEPDKPTAPLITPDIPMIVGWLRAALVKKIDPSELPATRPIGDDESLFEAVHEIRQAMARRPWVLVFVGVRAGTVNAERTQMDRHIADDDLCRLLSRLLEGPICSVPEVGMLERWCDNRIVLLADEPVIESVSNDVGPMPEEPDKDNPVALDVGEWCLHMDRHARLRAPDEVVMSSDSAGYLIAEDGSRRLSRVQCLRDSYENNPMLYGARSELVLELVDALCQARAMRTGELEALSPGELGETHWDGPPGKQLVRALMAELDEEIGESGSPPSARRRRAWRALLSLIACSPDGVRRQTVGRIVERTSTDPHYATNPLPELDAACVGADIGELLETFPKLVSEGGNDRVEALDRDVNALAGAARASLRAQGRRARSEQERALHFPLGALRGLLVEWMSDEVELGDYQALHRAIADDALRQVSAILRRTDASAALSLRGWRRLLSVLNSGLQSLEIERNGSASATLAEELLDPDAVVHGQAAFWRWLYFFAFRRMLERAPAFNLSRFHGADSLKKQILEAFDDPTKLWPTGYRNAHHRRLGSVSIVRRLAELNTEGLFGSHRRALARTSLSLGNLTLITSILRELDPEQAPDLSGTPRSLHLTATKLALDVRGFGMKPGSNDVRERLERLWTEECVQLQTVRLSDGSLGGSVAARALQAIIRLQRAVERDLGSSSPDALGEGASEDARNALSGRARAVRSAAYEVIDTLLAHLWPRDEIASVVDVVFRIGEHHAIAADLELGHESDAAYADSEAPGAGGPAEAGARRRARVRRVYLPDTLDARADQAPQYAIALAVFTMAEELRRALFARCADSDVYFASGNVQRQFIRTALRLSEIRRARHGRAGPYVEIARRQADEAMLHLFRYPRERASMLIVEADIARSLALGERGPVREELLKNAVALLADAEEIALGLGRETRLRLRLAACRAAVHIALLRASTIGRPAPGSRKAIEAERCASLANADIVYLNDHPLTRSLGYWPRRTAQLRDALERARRRLPSGSR